MTMTHDELRKLAEAATPGPWEIAERNRSKCFSVEASPSMKIVCTYGDSLAAQQDSAYIAAANPKTVLELLDEIAELEGEIESLHQDAAGESL